MGDPGVIRMIVDVELAADDAFSALLDELATALRRHGIELDTGPGGRVSARETQIARVGSWRAGRHAVLEWCPADWQPDQQLRIEIDVDTTDTGSRVTLERGEESVKMPLYLNLFQILPHAACPCL